MPSRSVSALFATPDAAAQAAARLRETLGVADDKMRVTPGLGEAEAVAAVTGAPPSGDGQLDRGRQDSGGKDNSGRKDTGIIASVASLFVPDEQRPAEADAARRGITLVAAEVDEGDADRAAQILRDAGALDPAAQAAWPTSTATPSAGATDPADRIEAAADADAEPLSPVVGTDTAIGAAAGMATGGRPAGGFAPDAFDPSAERDPDDRTDSV